MSEPPRDPWAAQVEARARAFVYPPTPDVAGAVRARLRPQAPPTRPMQRVAWALALVLTVGAGLWSVPQVRAGVLEFLQLGAVRIWLVVPTPSATLPPPPKGTAPPTGSHGPPSAPPPPRLAPTPLGSVLALSGATTLEEAMARAEFPVRLPAALERPERVFFQQMGGGAVVLVWLDAAGQPCISLHLLGPETFVGKGPPEVVAETTVNGRHALWTTGPYFLTTQDGSLVLVRLISGHVLIWEEAEITYRLESQLSLDEAVRIAESLR